MTRGPRTAAQLAVAARNMDRGASIALRMAEHSRSPEHDIAAARNMQLRAKALRILIDAATIIAGRQS